MRAVRLLEFGPPENLRYEEAPDPVPGEGQVRIAAEASGVHLIDTAVRAGNTGGGFPLPGLPMVPGRDMAGTVDAVGPGVEERWVGRRVVAYLGPAGGGYAEAAVAPVDGLHELPGDLSADVAVAMIGTGRTAVWILDAAALKAKDVVVVTAATGGMGTLFVQAARNLGAFTVGLAGGPDKTARAIAAGADVAVDYLESGWPDRLRERLGDREATVVLDGVGGKPGRDAMELLGVGGRLLMFGWAAGEPTWVTTDDLVARSLTASWVIGPRLDGLRELETRALEEAAAGRLVPVVQRFALERAAGAHAALESRATVGKVVFVP